MLAGAVLTLFVAMFFAPVFTRGQTFSTVANVQQYSYPWVQPGRAAQATVFPQLDQAVFVHPRQVFLDRAIKVDNQVPLWNPMTFGGHPFLAEAGSRLAYPPYVLLSLLFDPIWTHDLYVVLHVLVAGIAVIALMRELKVGPAGSLLAGVAWALSSYSSAWVMLEMFAAPAALLPLALLCLRRWHDRRSLPALLWCVLVLGFLFLGTSMELALISFICVGLYAGGLALSRLVGRWGELSARQRVALVAAPGFVLLGAVAVAAVSLVPFLELSGSSERAASSPLTKSLPVTVGRFWWALLPPPVSTNVYEAAFDLLTGQVFVGTATALLAVVGLFRRRPGSGLGRGLAVGIFLFAVGTPVTWLALTLAPRLRALGGFGRALFLWNLGVAVLGGLGLDAVVRRVRSLPRSGRGARAATALAAIVCTVCVVSTGAQLLAYGRRVNPPFQDRRPAELFPSTAALDASRSVAGPALGRSRVLPVQLPGAPPVLPGAAAMAVDLPVASGYEPVLPAAVTKLTRLMGGEPEERVLAEPVERTFWPVFLSNLVRTDLLGRAGVAAVVGPPDMALDPGWSPEALANRGLRQTYSGPDGTVYEVQDRAPRASVVTDAHWVSSPEEAFSWFTSPGFDGRRQVVLEGSPPDAAPLPSPLPSPSPPTKVEWREDRPNTVRLEVTSPTAGWLVLLDSWDPGWKATVNGRGREVVHANYTFRAVAVPAGRSTVRFAYRPTSVRLGALASVVAISAVLGWLVVLSRRRRRTGLNRSPAA